MCLIFEVFWVLCFKWYDEWKKILSERLSESEVLVKDKKFVKRFLFWFGKFVKKFKVILDGFVLMICNDLGWYIGVFVLMLGCENFFMIVNMGNKIRLLRNEMRRIFYLGLLVIDNLIRY